MPMTKGFVSPPPVPIGCDLYKTILEEGHTADALGHQGLSMPNETEFHVATKLATGGLLAQTKVEHVWWHEALHAIENSYEFELDERNIDCLSTGIVQILNSLNLHVIKESR